MPFQKIDIQKVIEEQQNDPQFAKKWKETRSERKVLQQIVKMRNKLGLSQEDISKKTGIKQQVLSRIEQRISSPTLKTLCKILDAMDCQIEILFKSDEITYNTNNDDNRLIYVNKIPNFVDKQYSFSYSNSSNQQVI